MLKASKYRLVLVGLLIVVGIVSGAFGKGVDENQGRYIGDVHDYYLITSPPERVPGEGAAPTNVRSILFISI